MTSPGKKKPQPKSLPDQTTAKEKKWVAQDFRTTIRTSVTLVICVFIFVHLVMALIFLLSPAEEMINSKGINGIYKRYALPGPYFGESVIKSSPQFFFATKDNNAWSAWRNTEGENFKEFHQNYFRYDKLKKADFERHITRDFCRRVVEDGKENFISYHEFNLLHNYFTKEYLKGEHPDSIRIFYRLTRYKPRERKAKVDTLFLLTYKPW
jgi:hypothetical protein